MGEKKACRLSGLARKVLMGVSISTACLASSGVAWASTTHHKSRAAVPGTHLGTHHSTAATTHAHHGVASHPAMKHVAANHTSSHSHSHNHNVAATSHNARRHYAAQYHHSGLQCVPYAREVSHIQLAGNAYLWWAEAAGRYARGNAPEEGAVLNFRSVGRMPLGHVAVVTAVLDNRTILITQANWVRGTITNDVTVQDVSPRNDWSLVKVELGDSSQWGSPYPAYGFIYNRPDAGTVIAANGQGNEVAEAPAAARLGGEAPNRNLQ
jgi:surface antigen